MYIIQSRSIFKWLISQHKTECSSFIFMDLITKWINNTIIIMVHTNVKYIGIWIQKWISSITSAIFKCFEIKINRSILFENISENVKTSLWVKIDFKVDEMGTCRVVPCFWVIGSKSKLTSFGSINYSWFLTYSLRAFLPLKVWKAIPNGLSQVKICPVLWSQTKFWLFLLILNLHMGNCILFCNCKTWTIFSLTKHNASFVIPYFLHSSRRKLAISLTR